MDDMKDTIYHGTMFVNYLYLLATKDREWLDFAEDCESLVKMLSLDYAEALRAKEIVYD